MELYRSNRIEKLADALAELLREPVGDPTTSEWVVVHSLGMARWLSMHLAQRLGVCANVEFPFPARLVHNALGAVLGSEVAPTLAWRPERLQWAILDALPSLVGDEAFAPLASWLDHARQSRTGNVVGRAELELARRIADVFDRYLTYRPDLVRAWEAGPGAGGEEELGGWQGPLWRALKHSVDAPHLADSAAELVRLLAQGRALEAEHLPPRIAVFGVSALPPFYVELLGALSQVREVHLFVLCPSAAFWGLVQSRRDRARLLRHAERDVLDASELHMEEGHPVLASFGRLGRDFQVVLEGSQAQTPYTEANGDELFEDPWPSNAPTPPPRGVIEGAQVDLFDQHHALFATQPAREPTLLEVLQSDILHLRHRGLTGGDERVAPGRWAVSPDDRSIQFHACHGPMRQVEVLRDRLLALFDEDPGLEPRHVVVMTPDIEAYAPLVEAVFGAEDIEDSTSIPWRLADRSLRHNNPIAEALLQILQLVTGRVTATEILDLLVLEPVRDRFGLTAEDLPQLQTWVREAGIRWGIDAAHREEHGQPAFEQNTWRFGFDRLLLGTALPGDDRLLFGGVLPWDEVEGLAGDLLGRFIDGCETLFGWLRALKGPRSIARWRVDLLAALDALSRNPDDDDWLRQQVREVLDTLAAEAEASGLQLDVALPALRAELEQRFASSAGPSGFLSGSVTFCAMVPMRSVPFRVVCLLGMDDGAFPRGGPRPAFDLTARSPRVGDRDARDEDRYLLLEALLAAREHVLVLYTGRGQRSNEHLPPAVPIGELLDELEEAFELPPGYALVQEHPLQPFSPLNFVSTEVDGRTVPPLSFDRRYLAGARLLRTSKQDATPFFEGALTESDAERVVTIDQLARFFRNPTAYLLQDRLGVSLTERDEPLEDREPVELDALQRWKVGNDDLDRQLEGVAVEDAWAAARAAGRLPLGTPGRCLFDDVARVVDPLREAVAELQIGEQRSVGVDLRVPHAGGETRLLGRVRGVWSPGLVVHQYSRVSAHHQLGLWLRHVVLHLADPEQYARQAHLVGRGYSGVERVSIGRIEDFISFEANPFASPEDASEAPAGAGGALGHLARLIELFWYGQTRPLPFFPETSRVLARYRLQQGRRRKKSLEEALLDAWHGGWMPGDKRDPHVNRVYGSGLPFEPDFSLPGLAPDPAHSFEAVALTIWQPIFDHGGDR